MDMQSLHRLEVKRPEVQIKPMEVTKDSWSVLSIPATQLLRSQEFAMTKYVILMDEPILPKKPWSPAHHPFLADINDHSRFWFMT
jgi:hypothetical protein